MKKNFKKNKIYKQMMCSLFMAFMTVMFSYHVSLAAIQENVYKTEKRATTAEELKNILAEAINESAEVVEIRCDSSVFTVSTRDEFFEFIKELKYETDDYHQNILSKSSYSGMRSGENLTLQFKFEYIETPEETAAVEQEVQRILGEIIKPDMSEDEKVKEIHDYIVTHVQYDSNGLSMGNEAHTAYAALFYDKQGEPNETVCQGYALLFYRMLVDAGIEARIMTGQAGQPHAWNLVKINGYWYQTDITWNDPVMDEPDKNYVRYDYYNLTDEQFKRDHTVFDNPENYPKCDTEYADQIKHNEIMLRAINRHHILPEYTATNEKEFKDILTESKRHREVSTEIRCIGDSFIQGGLRKLGYYKEYTIQDYGYTQEIDDKIYTFNFDYANEVYSIKSNKSLIEVLPGNIEGLEIIAEFSDGSTENVAEDVRYLSSNTNVVYFDKNTNKLVAKEVGLAKVLLQYGGKEEEIIVTVQGLVSNEDEPEVSNNYDNQNNIPNEENYEAWNQSSEPKYVLQTHEWQIKFNKKVNEESLDMNIFILEKNTGSKIPVEIELVPNGETILLKQSKPFVSGGEYVLYINKDIKTEDGKLNLLKGIMMYFNIIG